MFLHRWPNQCAVYWPDIQPWPFLHYSYTTYQNVLVRNKSGNHPILLGPVLVHQTKTLCPFHYLASTLVRLNPNLVNLRAYGIDGEPELITVFRICFPNAVHLRCINHLRQNIKNKLRSLNIPWSLGKEFLADIFGKQAGSHLSMVCPKVHSIQHWRVWKRNGITWREVVR